MKLGITLLRLYIGIAFLAHGVTKFSGGIENTVHFFNSVGIASPMAYIVAILEIVGGIAMILGIATRLFALIFIILLIGAIITVKSSGPFVGGYELDLSYGFMSVLLLLTDGSAFSIDAAISKQFKKDTF